MSDLLGQSRVRRAVLPQCKSDHARSRQRETSSRSRTRQRGHRPRPSSARGGQRQGRGEDCRQTAGAQASRTEKRSSVRQHHRDAGEVTIEDERLARAISELPGVKRGRRDMVHKGVQELIMAAAQLTLGHGDATAKLRVAMQGVLDDGLDGEEDGYYSSEDEDEIDPETAAKGLGSVGRVHVHVPLWRRLVPQDLLRAYEKHAKAGGANLKSHCTKLPLMMRALHVDARGVKRTHLTPTSRAFLRPTNRQKCRMILDASPINGADTGRPQKFTLPGLEQLRDLMRGGGGGRVDGQTRPAECILERRTPEGLAQGFCSANRRQAVIPLHAPALRMALLPPHMPVPCPWHRGCRPARRAGPGVGVYRQHSRHRSQSIRGAVRSAAHHPAPAAGGFYN